MSNKRRRPPGFDDSGEESSDADNDATDDYREEPDTHRTDEEDGLAEEEEDVHSANLSEEPGDVSSPEWIAMRGTRLRFP